MPLDQDLTEFTTASPQLVNYDFQDVAEGTGITLFYGFVAKDSTGSTYRLSRDILYSAQIEETTAVSTTGFHSFVKFLDKDFDLSAFNIPKSIRGTAYVRFTSSQDNTSGIAGDVKYIVRVRKYSGSTETDIASVESENIDWPINPAIEATFILPVTIPLTNFQKGDILRLTIEGWASSDGNPGTTTGNMTIGTDPQNRDGTVIIPSTDTTDNRTTQIKFWCPFDLE
jgi:hypothetical protein